MSAVLPGSRPAFWPKATTELVGIIGDPVRHSMSPVLHNAALAAMGLDWAYVAFAVPAGRGAGAVGAMLDLGIRGLSVTMPHKADAASACDELSPAAERLGSVNTVANLGGVLTGESTDGPGLLDALAEEGWRPDGMRCVILGAGGAARSVALALAAAGASSVGVVARRADVAGSVALLAGAAGAVVGLDALGDADLVVNATPVGMTSSGLPFDLDPLSIHPGQMVADLIYVPSQTALLTTARARGAATANGLGMLIHQAARQLAIWTGQPVPLDVMSAAALAELRLRGRGA